ncbi:unnamed protein product [Zymoseptoria tritici ST99CH_3D7]|uniref:DFDF domain-containing protein n=1 Tax=Zymoseptoria tritici (strain ST99CH_3D7) TaxID=1276538 RepID=A0A1X7RIU7_ZYMT9|nr:unnamed protein product [Zymoseptoria tritici ST99CH_3D7]
MSEYIGSRISLISKSDIKYVGTLKSIDSETATVSLQDVQCHGTEGRKGNPAEEIPGSDTVYDGIVFRGSDVKDLTILAPPKENRPPQPQMPNDPAILSQSNEPPPQPQQQHQPPQQQQNQFRGPQPPYQQQPPQFGYPGPPPPHFQQQPRFQGPGGAHGFPGQPGAVPGYGMGFGGPPPPGYGMGMGYGPPPGNFPPPPPGGFQGHQQPIGPPGQQMNQQRPQQQMPPQQMQQQQQQGPNGSKQNTPQQPGSSQAPPASSAPTQNKLAEMSEKSTTPAPTSAGAPPPPTASKPSTAAATAPAAAPKPTNRANNRVAVPLAPSPAAVKVQPKPQATTQQAPPQAHKPSTQPPAGNATEAATAAVAAAMAKLGATNRQGGGVDVLTKQVDQMRVQDGQYRGRGRGRGPAGPRQGRRESLQKNIEVPKEDFDFQSANAKFNKQELVKEAIATGEPVNGDAADPSSNGADADDEDIVIPAKPTADKGYDKKSSFFDNISSDLKDRTQQQDSNEYFDGRAMRAQERNKNMDTFGQGSVDGGGFRGRGRGRGRGGFTRGRGGGGGGYYNNAGSARGGFEQRGGYRGRGGGEATTAV